ncbi:uncharacterized protein PGRI_040520 [Penicillium griseofulvum]|uniref:Armadillo-like helical n=1 Tax=Penicillium patulum TaxID=5078 RepID=A0A135L978_PENPA|nr:uncharacterized protein PGRI_040520 [Penicillium griseofulvum]KXG45503.1 hypothetical protein PGRI_040520 [Penicillium griseofulvum]
MADPQSAKRARSNTIGDAHVNTTALAPAEDIFQRIEQLDIQTVTDILTQAAQIHPDVLTMVDDAIRYDVSFEVAEEVVETIQLIAEQCGPFTNPRTRFNGLSTLRKIGKTIALSSNDVVGHEVQERFQYDTALVTAMREIIESMTEDEVRAIRENESSPEALWPKLLELEELSVDHCIHPELGEVLNLLDPARCEDEDEEDKEEEDEEWDEWSNDRIH